MTPDSPPDDFDQFLRQLARPLQPGAELVAQVPAQPTHMLAPEVARSLRQAALPWAPQPGDVLDGRYRVTGVLGRGGMGVVLEAEQLLSNKVVAIKWMNAARDDEHSPLRVARFLREARAVANVEHPNVVALYDVGDSDGTPFLVLERLRGESLRARLDRGPLSWDDAKSIMLGVLQGVGAVHRAGIVHRDLKPDNIFLCGEGASMVPKVLDFGVAAVRATSQDGFDSLTRTGALLGTPAYMAPEQLTGGEVDARADIYALGVVGFEMLAGRLPFEARTAADLAVLQATRTPVLPVRIARGLGRERAQAILRSLAKQPDDRFATAEAMSQALGRSRSIRPVLLTLSAAAVAAAVMVLATPGGQVPAQPSEEKHIASTRTEQAPVASGHVVQSVTSLVSEEQQLPLVPMPATPLPDEPTTTRSPALDATVLGLPARARASTAHGNGGSRRTDKAAPSAATNSVERSVAAPDSVASPDAEPIAREGLNVPNTPPSSSEARRIRVDDF